VLVFDPSALHIEELPVILGYGEVPGTILVGTWLQFQLLPAALKSSHSEQTGRAFGASQALGARLFPSWGSARTGL